jgi:hypothetical protein
MFCHIWALFSVKFVELQMSYDDLFPILLQAVKNSCCIVSALPDQYQVSVFLIIT